MNLAIHGGADESAFGVIPFEINSNVARAVLVRLHGVVVADEFLKALHPVCGHTLP